MLSPLAKPIACLMLFIGIGLSAAQAQIVSNVLAADNDISVSTHVEECKGESMLFFDITNNSSSPQTFQLVISYDHNGMSISETQDIKDLAPTYTYFLNCMDYQNFPKFGFASLGANHDYDASKMSISIIR